MYYTGTLTQENVKRCSAAGVKSQYAVRRLTGGGVTLKLDIRRKVLLLVLSGSLLTFMLMTVFLRLT